MPTSAPRPRLPLEKQFLAALPTKAYRQLLPGLEAVDLPINQVLHAPGRPLRHIYFPSAGMVSLVYTTAQNSTVEIGIVGREGMVGLSALLGLPPLRNTAVVQIAGSGLRMEAGVARAEFKRGGLFHDLVLRYMGAFLAQVSQTAVCNCIHPMGERLCRWLLMSHDRVRPDAVRLTQEFLSQMLGVHRPGVSLAAEALQRVGLIAYARGKITILDRKGLEAAACECYAVSKQAFDGAMAA